MRVLTGWLVDDCLSLIKEEVKYKNNLYWCVRVQDETRRRYLLGSAFAVGMRLFDSVEKNVCIFVINDFLWVYAWDFLIVKAEPLLRLTMFTMRDIMALISCAFMLNDSIQIVCDASCVFLYHERGRRLETWWQLKGSFWEKHLRGVLWTRAIDWIDCEALDLNNEIVRCEFDFQKLLCLFILLALPAEPRVVSWEDFRWLELLEAVLETRKIQLLRLLHRGGLVEEYAREERFIWLGFRPEYFQRKGFSVSVDEGEQWERRGKG